MRSLLALKLFGNARHSHVMSSVLDEGLALFAGLNVIPKRSFLTEYSCRDRPGLLPEADATLVRRRRAAWAWSAATSFDLDFHTIPFHGDDALVEKHYVSKRSRRQKGMLAFLAQDADTRVFCYANGELRKDRAERRDPPLRRVLEAADRPLARGTDLRLQADDLRQPQPAEPDGDPVHHAAAAVQEAPRRDRPDARRRPGGGSNWRASRARTRRRASWTAGSR